MKVERVMRKSLRDTPIHVVCHAMELLETMARKKIVMFSSTIWCFVLLYDLIFQ